MNYKTIYEKQYAEKKLVSVSQKQFLGLRRLLSKYDIDRNDIAQQSVDSGDKILEVGCGNGNMLLRLSDKFNELYGLDVASSRLKEAEINIKETSPKELHKFRFIEGNADDSLPFNNDFFDAVVSIATIEHVYDIFYLVKEMYRVLKPGGFLIAEVPNIAYLRHRLHLLFGKLPVTSSPYNWMEIGWDGGHIHYFTQTTFCRLLEECGFKVIKVSGSGFLAKFRSFYHSLLTGDICVKAKKE